MTRNAGCAREAVRSETTSKPQGLAVGRDAAALSGVLAPHVGAPAEELLHLALVGVLVLGAPHHRGQPQVLGELDHGFAARVSVVESGRLEQAVVHTAP